jgi:hypothetical protein
MKLVPSLEVLNLFHDDRHFDVQSWLYHESLRLFLRDTHLQHLTRLELVCAIISDGYFEEFLSFWYRHAGSLTHLTLTCLQLSRESRHVEARNSWPGTLEKMSRRPFKLSFLKIQGLYGPNSDLVRQAVMFSETFGPWGCDECLTSLWRDGSQTVGNASCCGDTTYESDTGQWPTPEIIRADEQYFAFVQ